MTNKWEVHTKGGPDSRTFEIAVIRANNEHGKRSYGWFGPDKLLITHCGGPCNDTVTPEAWDLLIVAAHQLAQRKNSEEGHGGGLPTRREIAEYTDEVYDRELERLQALIRQRDTSAATMLIRTLTYRNLAIGALGYTLNWDDDEDDSLHPVRPELSA
jgi:hypothetical protein